MSESGGGRKLKLHSSSKTERVDGALVSVAMKTLGKTRKSHARQRQELTRASDFRPGFAVAGADRWINEDLAVWPGV